MSKGPYKYIIVGAGLSGLVTAHALYEAGETDFLVLEGRSRIGGRIQTVGGVEYGATWFQDDHVNLVGLLDRLGVPKYRQYSQGKSVLVYNTMAPAHFFETDPSVPSAYRVGGGTAAVIQALAGPIRERIALEERVLSLAEKEVGIELQTERGSYVGEKVVVALPPRLAVQFDCEPELPEALRATMGGTHTWMSNAIKLGVAYDRPFWREKGLSGMLLGQVGPVVELYDHCDTAGKCFALMGFINEGLRDTTAEARKTKVLEWLGKYLGEAALSPLRYEECDWSLDPLTTTAQGPKSIYMRPEYGDATFERFFLGGRLLFSGAETSPVLGGYMEGAVFSGMRAAELLLKS